MRPLRRLAIGLWVAVFLFGGIWVGARWPNPSPPRPDPPEATGGAAPAEPDTRPDARPAPATLPPITLKDLQGRPRPLSEWSGRTLLINFWATWCAPCRKEMPLLEQLQQSQDPARLQVIGIAIDRLEPVLRFVGEIGVSYPILAGEMDATRAAEQFGDAFVGLPFSVVVAPDGTILAIHTGEIHAADLEQIAAVAGQLAAGTLTSAQARGTLKIGRRPASS